MDLAVVPATLSNPLVAFPLVFLGGVLTSLTPCIYPMIPITAAVVGGQADVRGTPGWGRPAVLTFAYVAGVAGSYALLGVVAGLTGSLFGAVSTNPWLLFIMANTLLAFGLMMMDVLPVPVPRRLLQRAASVGAAGRVVGALGMGAASGLVAAPCGAPVMASILTWVTVTQSALLGFAYLLAFSLGMCTLLVVVGLAAGGAVRLPKPGPWMVWVKRGFAVVLLGTAEYYLIKMGQFVL